MQSPKHRSAGRKHRAAEGQAIIEIVGGLIIFTIMLCLIMTITGWLYLQQAIVTSAREGARQASLNDALGVLTTQVTGITATQAYVINEVKSLTGQAITASNVTVTPPTGVVGSRMVTVTIKMNFVNPVKIDGFLSGVGVTGANTFGTIPVSSQATMRYED